jgi:hypothetical protein
VGVKLAGLPEAGITAKDVGALAVDESDPRLAELVQKEWKRFRPDGLAAMEALAGVVAPTMEPLRFTQAESYRTGIAEQSALTFVTPEVGFVAVADDSSVVHRVKPPKKPGGELVVEPLTDDDGAMDGLEGASFNRGKKTLRTVSENSRKVFEMKATIDGERIHLAKPRKIGKLERVQKDDNSGWEGFATLPAELSPDGKEYQLAANEARPRRIGLFDPKTLAMVGSAKIPDELKDLLLDLADVAVSKRGTLAILSEQGNDQKGVIAEVALRRIERTIGRGRSSVEWKLIPIGVTKIETKGLDLGGAGRLQAEGLDFDQKGDLWVACEANSLLIRFAQK